MNKLYTFKLAVPVLKVSSKVTHSTPRKPTVIEHLILDLSQHKKQLQDYGEMPLRTIFEEVLKIPDANELTKTAFDNLINLSILKGYYDDLSIIPLRTLQLSDHDNTRYFIERGQLPAQPRNNIVDHYYHSVRRTLVPKGTAQAREYQTIPSLPDSLIGELYPEQAIKQNLQTNNYPWLSKISEISRLEVAGREMLYVDCKVDLVFDGRILSLRSDDEALNQQFNDLPTQARHELMQQVVAHFNGLAIDTVEPVDVTRPELRQTVTFVDNQSSIRPLHKLAKSATELAKESTVIFHLDPSELMLKLPEELPALTVCFSEQAEPTLRWNSDRAILLFPRSEWPDGIQYIEGSLLNRRFKQYQVADVCLPDSDSQQHILRMVGERGLSLDNPLLVRLKKQLEHQVQQHAGSEEWQLLSSFWVPASELWQQWLDEPARPTLRERLQALINRYSLLAQISDQKPGSLAADLFLWLQVRLQSDVPLSRNRFELAVNLATLIETQDKKLQQGFLNWLQENSQPPQHYLDLAEYARLVKPFGQIGSDSCWLSSELLTGWLSDCGQMSYRKVLSYLPVAETLNYLHEVLLDLQTTFDSRWSKLLGDSESLLSLAREIYAQPDHKVYRQILRQYQRCYQKWLEYTSLNSSATDDSSFAFKVYQAVGRYLALLDRPEFLLEAASKVFIVDSCFLINLPDLPKQLAQGQILLVPRKVHEELDNIKSRKRKKKRNQREHGARKAINALKSNERGNMMSIDTDPALLPSDYEPDKPDNLILSAVLAYRHYEPVLLTDDNDMAVKAHGLNIPTLNTDAYKNGREPQRQFIKPISQEIEKETIS